MQLGKADVRSCGQTVVNPHFSIFCGGLETEGECVLQLFSCEVKSHLQIERPWLVVASVSALS